MTETKNGAKYIDKDPPMEEGSQSLGRKILDYLAYLKETLNFIFSNYGRRLTDANGNINELHRTATETTSRLADTEGNVTELTQRADEIESTVAGMGTDMSGMQSQITQNASAITSEVSRATAAENGLSTRLGTAESRITQTADAITSEVSRATAAEGALSASITQTAEGISLVSEKLNNIGGRNLIINTLEPGVTTLDQLPRLLEQPVATFPGTGISRIVLLPHGFKATKGTSAYKPSIQFNDTDQASLCGLEAGETYTLSAKFVWKVSTAQPLRLIMAPYVNGTIVPSDERPKIFWDPTTVGAEEEKYVVFTFTVPDGATNIVIQYNQPGVSASDYAETDYIGFDMIKLERGTVATAWTPAPEDMVGNDEIISKINVSPENITISASKVDLQGYVTFTNLSTSGETAINGANIITGTLNANAIAANSTFTQNLTATNFHITGGSIAITTDSARNDVINLLYQNYTSYMSPYGISGNDGTGSFSLSSTGRLTLKDPDGGGALFVYDNTQSRTAVTANAGETSCGIQVGSYDNSVRGYLQYSSTATNKISLVIEDGRMWLDKSALEFRNSSGYATARYTAEGDIQALSSGTLRMSLYSDEGLTFFDSSGTVTASYPASGWETNEQSTSVSVGATWTDSGLSYTVPKDGWYIVRGYLTYNNASPRGVMLGFIIPSNGYLYPFSVTENANGVLSSDTGKTVAGMYSCAPIRLNAGFIIKLYVKSAYAADNTCSLTVHGPIA